MNGVVTAVFLSIEKKKPRIEITEGIFLEDYGLEGDAYSSRGSKRQVAVLSEEGRIGVVNEKLDGLCFERFLETVRFSGIDMSKLKPGTRLRIGEAFFEVSKHRKKCYPECSIIKSGRVCSLVPEVRFLKVLKTGKVRKGDSVEIIKE